MNASATFDQERVRTPCGRGPRFKIEALTSPVRRLWEERDDIFYLTVTTDGTSGLDWPKKLRERKFRTSTSAIHMLRDSSFKPTRDVTINAAILPAKLLPLHERYTNTVYNHAAARSWKNPNPELGCLLRYYLTDEDLAAMGLLAAVAMHAPIKDRGNHPSFLAASRQMSAGNILSSCENRTDKWGEHIGFAFVVSQDGP